MKLQDITSDELLIYLKVRKALEQEIKEREEKQNENKNENKNEQKQKTKMD